MGDVCGALSFPCSGYHCANCLAGKYFMGRQAKGDSSSIRKPNFGSLAWYTELCGSGDQWSIGFYSSSCSAHVWTGTYVSDHWYL